MIPILKKSKTEEGTVKPYLSSKAEIQNPHNMVPGSLA